MGSKHKAFSWLLEIIRFGQIQTVAGCSKKKRKEKKEKQRWSSATLFHGRKAFLAVGT